MTSFRLPPVSVTARGIPAASVITVVLAAQLAPVDRARTGALPPLSARSCDESTIAADRSRRTGGTQLGQDQLVQLRTDLHLNPLQLR
ncbi:hypothetical protein GCM10027610_014840 [Dactylosporangium cerinum]